MAQLVEHHLAKVRVASSNLVIRSDKTPVSSNAGRGLGVSTFDLRRDPHDTFRALGAALCQGVTRCGNKGVVCVTSALVYNANGEVIG